MNKFIGAGRLTKDPDVRYTESGVCRAMFTLAINRRRSRENMADFVPIVAWDKLAEIVGNHLAKGSQVVVEGRFQTRSYEKDGQKHYVSEILADDIEFLGSKPATQPAPANQQAFGQEVQPDPHEDIPF